MIRSPRAGVLSVLTVLALGASGTTAAAVTAHGGQDPVHLKGTLVSIQRANNRIQVRVGKKTSTFITNSVTVVITAHHATTTLAALKKGEVVTVSGDKIGPIETAVTITIS